jgi:DNA-binding MarR family transcriptional regulator
VYLNLWRTYDCLKSIEEALFGRFELSAQQYNALRLLRSAFPESMPTLTLGRRLISRGPDTTRMLDRLERRGLVTRQRLTDNRRVVAVAITEAGLALLADLDAPVREMHQQQLGHLSRDEHSQLIDFLRAARLPHEDASCDWLDSPS